MSGHVHDAIAVQFQVHGPTSITLTSKRPPCARLRLSKSFVERVCPSVEPLRGTVRIRSTDCHEEPENPRLWGAGYRP